MQYVIALCLLLSFFTFVCMHTWRTILRKRTILRSNEEEIRGIGVSRRGGGRRSEEREKGFFFRSNDRKRVDGRTSSSYINEFVFDLSNRYRQRRQIIDSKEKETNRVLRNELLKVCANCRPGGAHDGGVLLDKTTGLCTAWCSKGNYCGETATYKSSSKSVDCRTLSTFEGSDDDVAYEVWKSNVESQFAFGKAARDLLTCVECRSGHNSDGGVQRFRDQFCDRWCSVSPWGLPGGYCGTSGGYRNGGTDCQFMARFHDDANKLVAEWIDLVRRQLDANPDDTYVIGMSTQFLQCARCGSDELPCTGLCNLQQVTDSDSGGARCITNGFDHQPATARDIDCRAFRDIFEAIELRSSIDPLVSRAVSNGAPSIPSVHENERRVCREHCSRSGLLLEHPPNGPQCYRFCSPKSGHCSNIAESVVDCHEKRSDLLRDVQRSTTTTTTENAVVITVPERVDRLGSYMQMIFGLRYVAAYFGWMPRAGHCEMGQMLDGGRVKIPVAEAFGWVRPCFEVDSVLDCGHLDSSLASNLCAANTPLQLTTEDMSAATSELSGFYITSNPWSIVRNIERSVGRDAAFSSKVASMLRTEFLRAPQREAERDRCEFCASHDDLFRIAVHVRRGDITKNAGRYAKAFISDETYIRLIDRVAKAIDAANRRAHVVVFSEAYGTTDWPKWADAMRTLPGVASFKFRLSSTHGSNDERDVKASSHNRTHDRELLRSELSDIHDFVVADLLIVGGTFSAIAGILRPPESGATLFFRQNHGYFGYVKDLSPSWWIGFERDGTIGSPPCELTVLMRLLGL